MLGVVINGTFIELKTRNIKEYEATIENIKNACQLPDNDVVEFGYSYGKLSSVVVSAGVQEVERYPVTSVADNNLIA